MAERQDLYRILQVDPAADPLVIRAAFRTLAQIFHPDVQGDDEAMKRLNHAWDVLGDARRRAAYDAERAQRIPAVALAKAPAPRPAPAADHAGPPQGQPFGPVILFGRYEGWTLGQVALVDPPFLEWLRRVPAGRGMHDDIDAALRRGGALRTVGARPASRFARGAAAR
jgi:curved DNA-binding protein CbpA